MCHRLLKNTRGRHFVYLGKLLMNMDIIRGECGLANTYILWKDMEFLIIIDPADSTRVKEFILEYSNKICYVFLTHEHWDHINGLSDLKASYNVKVISSKKCSEAIQSSKYNLSKYMPFFRKEYKTGGGSFVCNAADMIFEDKKHIVLSGIRIDLFETPGHSPGSSCVQVGNMLFTGDTVLKQVKDIFRMPGCNLETYRSVTLPLLKQLYFSVKDIVVYPGHGDFFYLRNILVQIEKYLEAKE